MRSQRMARPLPALVVTVIAGVLAGSLGHAPAAVAAPPQPAKAKSEVCERIGDTTSQKADCVTLRIVGDSSTDVGEDIRVTGRVHESKRQEKTRVVIERAIDGGTWHDHGKRWTKVTTVNVGPSGQFATDVTIHRRGLHTLRARVIDPSSKGNAPSAAPKTRSVDLRDSGGDSLSDSVQATGGHMGSGISFHAAEGVSGSLQVQCLAMGGGQAAWTDKMNLPATCAFVGDQSIPTVAGLFRLVKGDTIYAIPSTDDRYTLSPSCTDGKLGVQHEGTLADVTIAETSLKQDLDMGYNVFVSYLKEGETEPTSCNYLLVTKLQSGILGQAPWEQVLEAFAVGAIAGAILGTAGAAFLGSLGVFGSVAAPAIIEESGAAMAADAGASEAGVSGFNGSSVIEEDSNLYGSDAWKQVESNWGSALNTVRFGPVADADAAEADQWTEEEFQDQLLGNNVEYVGSESANTLAPAWVD